MQQEQLRDCLAAKVFNAFGEILELGRDREIPKIGERVLVLIENTHWPVSWRPAWTSGSLISFAGNLKSSLPLLQTRITAPAGKPSGTI